MGQKFDAFVVGVAATTFVLAVQHVLRKKFSSERYMAARAMCDRCGRIAWVNARDAEKFRGAPGIRCSRPGCRGQLSLDSRV